MLNLDEVRIKGLDVKIRSAFQLGEIEVSPMLNYGFLQALDYSNSKKSYYKNQIPYTPKHSGSFVLAASYKRGILITVLFMLENVIMFIKIILK